jgi:DNA-binding NarL/FixJ family response regulator
MPRSAILQEIQQRYNVTGRLGPPPGKHPLVALAAADVAPAPLIILGPREQQVADLLLTGASNAEIAQELGMALRTVKAHLNTLYKRYRITTGMKRVKLVVILYRDA